MYTLEYNAAKNDEAAPCFLTASFSKHITEKRKIAECHKHIYVKSQPKYSYVISLGTCVGKYDAGVLGTAQLHETSALLGMF